MNMEKFTERSRGFIQAAQTIAIREENQRVVPEHLLKALMDDDQGLAANLITRAGGDARRIKNYMKAIQSGTSEKEAQKLLLDGRSYEELAKEIEQKWRKAGVKIRFRSSS